ncbi:hypothetical protein FCM35_KLT13762 [Carex littledalei]|uniref:Uncharacterized protein n=1 Tax=Carex littledalei TaxID=544730 RepID=A0A833QKI1_9POAL|nr:hypothetical protein FCM35_KLT13762 [Carex littledalei]
MDFHSLARKDLQAMCKNNKIPANLTNAAMADALQSLKSIEWVEEIKQKLMPQSEAFEQHGSPLPRSRRVAAISSDISGFSMGEINDKEEEMKKEALIEANQTPSTAVRRSRRIQSSMSTRTREGTSTAASGMGTCTAGTRTGKGKKEEAPAEAVDSVVVATPAPQRGRRKAVETPAQGVVSRSSARPTGMGTCTVGTRTRKGKKEEAPAEAVDTVVVETPAPQRGRRKAVETPTQGVVPRSSARPTRQSTRRLAESTEGTRVTRTLTKLALDPADDKEAETDVIELGRATEPKPADKLEVKEMADQNQVNEVSEEAEQAEEAEEQTEIPQEKSNTEESTHEELSSKTSEQKEILTEFEAVEEQLNSNVSEEEKEIITEKVEEAVEEQLNSNVSEEEKVASLLCDELKDDVSDEKLVEEDNAAVISEGQDLQNAPSSDGNQTTLADSPIMGLVSEIMQENNSDLQNAPSSDIITLDLQSAPSSDISILDLQNAPSSDIITLDLQNAPSSDIITLDLQNAPSGLCLSSPIRAPADEGVEKMLDSVVRHFANARLSSNTKMIDASVVQKEVTDKVVSDDGSELVQNENADKERVDLKSMSLRKLKALYKDRLNEMNSTKIVEDDGKRLPLGKLDENLLV